MVPGQERERGSIWRMPEDADFGDIDDAQLEAAMAALLRPPSGAPVEPRAAPTEADAFAWPDPDPEPPLDVGVDADGDGGLEPGPEPDPDLDVSLWAPVAAQAASDMALQDAGFGSPLHTALGDLAGINSGTLASSPPPAEPPPSSAARPGPSTGSRLAAVGTVWSERKRELVAGAVVALLVLLGLGAVIASMTSDDGSGRNVNASAPTSAVPTTTTIALAAIPLPPPPLPVEVPAPPAPAVTKRPGLGPKRFRAPAKQAAAPSSPKSGPAAPSGGGGSATGAPSGPPGPGATTLPPETSPPTTSPTTTEPPTTSPPTTSPPTTEPRDPCALIDDPIRLQQCRDRT
jgi:hypothetical protein